VNFQEFSHKKVMGVPVLYLAGGFVVILAIVAWKMKSTTTATDTTSTDTSSAANAGTAANAINGSDYAGLASDGTVVVAPQPTTTIPTNSSITTNTQWVNSGVQWLVTNNKADGTTANQALSDYINGNDIGYSEKLLVDMVIAQYGLPPDGSGGGSIGGKPATKQFTPPGTHTVEGGSDNSYGALASLYYGSASQDRIDLLEAANIDSIGHGPWSPGTHVNIPAYHIPKYYTVTASKGENASSIAGKNSISLTIMAALNNVGSTYKPDYHYNKGARIRVA